ncbi:peptidyl-prolyl cis-trans isomerase [Lagierella sp.]|uniref:peptidylprolyl isomerase n=1 Tax=Lagierella sp. TaxID=2849657 RepID=UPI00260859AB|nr:peptidyl-prolyl cis-trans isomerase [Lagierella sp.]
MEDSKILANVNGRDITRREVESFIRSMGPQGNQFNTEEGIKKVCDELINQELFYLDAINNKYEQEEAFKKELEVLIESALKNYAINKVLSSAKISDEEVREYYDSHKEYFKTPEQISASHILVDSEEKANALKKEILDGKEFEMVAKENSSCPSGANGGSLGRFGKGQMVPEFEQAAFNSEVGEITDPVKTQFGYHLIRVDEKFEPSTKSFDEVKEQVKSQLLALKQQEIYLNKATDLKKEYKVEKFY